MKVIKRDGHMVEWCPEKIEMAIEKANAEVEEDGKNVPEDLKYKKNFYDVMSNALSEWDFGNWPGDMVLKCNDMELARQMIVHLFKNDFSLESAMEVYNKLKTKR